MECLQATEIISAAHDGPVPADALAEAQAHCRICSECAAFRDLLARIDRAPAPRAPEELVARLLALAARSASLTSHGREEVGGAAESAPSSPAAPLRRRTHIARWSPRVAAYAAAAAVLLVAIGVTTATLLGPQAARETSMKDDAGLRGGQAPLAPPSSEGAKEERAAAADYGYGAPAPAYIALEGGVWRLHGPAEAEPSDLTTAGAVVSSLGEEGSPATFWAFATAASPDTLYIRAADATYLAFVRVTRTLGRQPYQLQAGGPLLRFGEWPTLPERFPAPTDADGGPTFRFFATDDLGVKVYVPLAGGPDDGIAVPPNTPPDDPAAGNPNWTWWEPVAP